MSEDNERSVGLRGVTWDHSRGFTPLVAVSQRFEELNPNIRIAWDKRSLADFESEPIDQLAGRYDLLVIDHPWAGFAARRKVLVDLNKVLEADFLSDQRENSVGDSYASYDFDGFQSALPIDAASPVALWRPDSIAKDDVPRTFGETLELARTGRVIYAAMPTYVLNDFISMCVTIGGTPFGLAHEGSLVERPLAEIVLDDMRELARACDPVIFELNPISLCEVLASDERYAYCPSVYGYVNYSRRGYAEHRLKAGPIVSYGRSPLRGVLGGTGIAISSRCKDVDAAARFLRYAASGEVQRTLYCDGGGQPGHRSAWVDPECNRQTLDFFLDTLPTLDDAYLRPRYDGYLYFQGRAGVSLCRFLQGAAPMGETISELDSIYQDSLRVGR